MEQVYMGSSVILAAQLVKTGYVWGKYWWTRKSDAVKYIELAQEHCLLDEKISVTSDTLMIEDCIESVDIVVTENPRKRVKHHGLFRNFLVVSGRAKFGCPVRSGANLLVVRKFLYDVCTEHGVLARHIAQNLDFAVELVFVPTSADLLARAVRHTKVAKKRIETRNELGGLPTLP